MMKKKEKLYKIKIKKAICLRISQITHIVPHKSNKSHNILDADSKTCLPTIHAFHSEGRIFLILLKIKKIFSVSE